MEEKLGVANRKNGRLNYVFKRGCSLRRKVRRVK